MRKSRMKHFEKYWKKGSLTLSMNLSILVPFLQVFRGLMQTNNEKSNYKGQLLQDENRDECHTIPWNGYPSKCLNIPGNFWCPLRRSILWSRFQFIVQVTNDAHGKKPQDMKLHPVFHLECEHTRNIRISKLLATFAANPEPLLTT